MRFLIRSILALTLLAFVAVAALFFIPAERVVGIAADKFTAATGRSLTIEGSVRPTFWPSLGVKTGTVTISNADWSREGPMLKAEALDISLDMAALIGGTIKITGVKVTKPRIMLERARDGRENWVFDEANAADAAPGEMASEATPFTLELAEVKSGALTYIDHGSELTIALGDVSGKVTIPDSDGPADVDFTAVVNGQTAKFTAKIAQFAPFLAGKVTGFDLSLEADKAKIAFAGRAGISPPEAAGKLTGAFDDLTAISRLAGIARPGLPRGLGADFVGISGDLTLTEKGSAHLRGGTVTLDSTRLSADADLTTDGPRPKLSAQIVTGALQLAGMTQAAPAGNTTTAPDTGGWSSSLIDVSALAVMDATIALSADSIDLGRAKLGATRLVMTIERSRAVFDLRQVAAYQGTLTGEFVINGRGGLSMGGDLRAAGIALQPLLQDVAGYDRLIGDGDLALKFLAVGNSTDALMRGLSGSGSVRFGKGELRGLDLAGMLRSLNPGFVGEGQKTIFDGISGSYTIDKGVLSNSDLLLRAPYVTATGAGSVGIGARSLDYRLVPTALAASDGTGGVKVPLLITGPWAKPKFRLDLESLAKERFEVEAKEAEARAKAAFEAKAAAELGVVREEGESFEDAAKRRAKEAVDAEAGRLLERLLGGN